MSKNDIIPENLRDPGTERALIATIIKNGRDAFIDADGIVCSNDFATPINRAAYSCLASLAEDGSSDSFDVESIKLKARTLRNIDLENNKNIEYLELLSECSTDIKNINMFAMQIKKCSVKRDLYDRYVRGIQRLEDSSGNESLSEIISSAESDILDYLSGSENSEDQLITLGETVMSKFEALMDKDPVDQIGIPTGYPIWDRAIGGGLRPGTVNVIGARPKASKSFLALNQAMNIAKLGIPVLYLDTELNIDVQQNRMIGIHSGCPLYLYETGKFKHDKTLVAQVKDAAEITTHLPIYYQSINGLSPSESLALARRWIVKHVGIKSNGKANDCVIIYDYFKLTDSKDLKSYNPEHIAIGFLVTSMHNFAHKYGIPLIGYVQLNRDGIDGNDTNIVSQSDRILWLCSSLSFLKNKNEDDVQMGCGWDFGNKKLFVSETRYGSGLENQNDYINLIASLKPMVTEVTGCGSIREGYLYSSITNRGTA